MFNCIDVQIVELIKDNKVTIQIKQNGEWHEITREDFDTTKRSQNGSDN
jgi:hypothetical protein